MSIATFLSALTAMHVVLFHAPRHPHGVLRVSAIGDPAPCCCSFVSCGDPGVQLYHFIGTCWGVLFHHRMYIRCITIRKESSSSPTPSRCPSSLSPSSRYASLGTSSFQVHHKANLATEISAQPKTHELRATLFASQLICFCKV